MATAGRDKRGGAAGEAVRSPARSTLVQRQARALGDPTRHAIFRQVAEAPEPVSVAALTRSFGLNHNAVRQHLAKLCEAGLLREEVAARAGPGRRPLVYRLSPSAAGTWGTPGPYEHLAGLLVEVLRSGRTPREVGAEAGRRMAPSGEGADPVERVEDEVARLGFEPRRVERGSSVELILQRCPFETVAAVDADIVCELHLGLAEGLVDSVDGAAFAGLVAREPRRAGCRLKMRRVTES